MNENDVVVLKNDFVGIKKIKSGTHGTVVFVSNSSKYVMVEFFDDNNNTISVETLLKEFVVRI